MTQIVLPDDILCVIISYSDVKTLMTGIIACDFNISYLPAFSGMARMHWLMQLIRLYRASGKYPPLTIMWMLKLTKAYKDPLTPHNVSAMVRHVNRWLMLGLITDGKWYNEKYTYISQVFSY